MTVALVTGGHGFVGSHVSRLLLDRGWDVTIVARRDEAAVAGGRFMLVDLTDARATADAVVSIRPDVTFHLAASTLQGPATVDDVVADAVGGTLNLCSALRQARRGGRVVIAGSSAQYGDVPRAQNPVGEDASQRPVNAYGFAKAAAEATACALGIDAGIEVIPVRAFNHVGPGEPGRTVAGALARRVAAVLSGDATRIEVDGLEAVRDFTDVRDIAAGYLAAADLGLPGRAYNLCSGRATSIGAILDGLLLAAGLDRSIVDVRSAEPGGVPYQVGSPARAREELGWIARIPLERSLADLLETVRPRTPATQAAE